MKRYFFAALLISCCIYYSLQQVDAIRNDGGVPQVDDSLEINEDPAASKLPEDSNFDSKPDKNEKNSYCDKSNIENITAQFLQKINIKSIAPKRFIHHLPESEYALNNVSTFSESEASENIEKIKTSSERKDLIGLLIETNLPEEQVVYDIVASQKDYSFYDLYSSIKYKEYFRVYSHIIDSNTVASHMTAEEINSILSLSIKVRNIYTLKDIVSRFEINKKVDFYRFIEPPSSTAEMLDNKIIFEVLSSNGFFLDSNEIINLIKYVGFDSLYASTNNNQDITRKQTKEFLSLLSDIITKCDLKNTDVLDYLSKQSNSGGADNYKNKEQPLGTINNSILTNKILNLISDKEWRVALNVLANRRYDENGNTIYSAVVDAAILNDAPIEFFEDIVAGGYIMNTDNIKVAAMRKNMNLLNFMINNVDYTNLSVSDKQQLLIFLDKSDIPDSVLHEVCTKRRFVDKIEKYPTCVKRTIHQ